MAIGTTEDPGLSPVTQLDEVEYPVWRDLLVRVAADNGASVDVINLFKSLPRTRYESKDEALRDLAEAARRFAMGNQSSEEDEALSGRRNLGRDHVEGAQPPKTRHP